MHTRPDLHRPVLSGGRGKVFLRPVHASDAPTVYEWENTPEFWSVSATTGPFSLSDIEAFIQQCQDLRRDGQIRFMICTPPDGRTVGVLDLFCSPMKRTAAGVGILIGRSSDRGKGFASDALRIMEAEAHRWELSTLECLVYPDNLPSLRLFERLGYSHVGQEPFRDKNALRLRKCL